MDDLRPLLAKLHCLLRSRGRSDADADDLVQEAFLRLQVYCRHRVVDKREAFLVRTALNLTVDQARQAGRMRLDPRDLESLQLADPQPTPDMAYAGHRRMQHWKRGMARLSPRRREVFLLNRVEGYTFTQIAQRLQISLSMVEKHAARALLFLTDWMDEEEADAP